MGCPTTIVGAFAFHDSVRNGKRWDHEAPITGTILSPMFRPKADIKFLSVTHSKVKSKIAVSNYSFDHASRPKDEPSITIINSDVGGRVS